MGPSASLYAGARYIVVRVLALECSKRPNPSEYRGPMHGSAYRFLRVHLPGSRVNKGTQRKGRGLQDRLRDPRETVEPPSHDEMEHDECENADKGACRERIDQKDRCRYGPNHPNHHAHPAKAPAKGRSPEHGHPEGNETYRHKQEPDAEQRIEYALGRLPNEDEVA
jgi:hypothetical protein